MPNTPRIKEYVLTLGIKNSIIGRWKSSRGETLTEIVCSRCRRAILIGDKVIRKAKNGRGRAGKRYHKKCAIEAKII